MAASATNQSAFISLISVISVISVISGKVFWLRLCRAVSSAVYLLVAALPSN